MSLNILVEVPQYSLTVNVQVRPNDTISDLKQEISTACPGNPRVEGQRLISKGRILKDTEKIDSIWVLEGEARVVHLAVSSWTTSPEIAGIYTPLTSRPSPQPTAPQAHSQPSPQPFSQRPVAANPYILSTPQPATLSGPVPYVRQLHYKALRALLRSAPTLPDNATDLTSQKTFAVSVFRELGLNWPSIFDMDFPPPIDGGVTYEYTLIGGKPFLQNLTPHEMPTPRQQHALNVLSYTFPLLELPLEQLQWFTPLVGAGNNVPTMQAAGNNQRAAVNIEVRIPVRALLTPLLFLCLRTLLLLYLFSPARKPVFGIMLAAWVLYEAWGAVRGAFGDNAPGERNAGNAAQPQRQADNNNANRAAMAPAFNPHQNPARFRTLASANADAVISRLSQLNLDQESRALNGEPNASAEPSIFSKVRLFFSLLVLSLHPAFWNRRRTALRSREGRMRTEANAREAAEQSDNSDGDERARQARQQLLADHARRPAWVQEYVERVRSGEWVDD